MTGSLLERRAIRIKQAWEKFIKTGILENYVVSLSIGRSWKRCFEKNINPYGHLEHLNVNSGALCKQKVNNNFVLSTAPFMDNIYNFVKGSGFIVILTNNEGLILKTYGDPVIRQKMRSISMEEGICWAESNIGTNAIGTCIIEKKALQVNATEHYCKILHDISGSAAPIFNPRGNLVGVLALIGIYRDSHLHTLGMMVAAVKAIENQLSYQEAQAGLIEANKYAGTIMGTMSEGVLLINREGIIKQINKAGCGILGLRPGEGHGRSAQKVFGENSPLVAALKDGAGYNEREMTLNSKEGEPLRFSSNAMPIIDESGEISGIVVTIREIKSVHRLVNRIVGAEASFNFENIITGNNKLLAIIDKAKRMAKSHSNILILGESGTGKEMFAQSIHNYSEYSQGPFIVINCGAIPRDLVESELFGYEDGAFTGAKKGGRPGKFELANGGTIFMDEIGDLPIELQPALLRVLQQRQVTRVGGSKVIPVNIRVISATHKDLYQEVQKGNFRLDLFYRLNVLNIKLPNLRDRKDDMAPLVDYFIGKFRIRTGSGVEKVSPKTYEIFYNYHWPGNIRELENVIEQALHAARGDTLEPEHLPENILPKTAPQKEAGKEQMSYSDHEAQIIKEALVKFNWNISLTAKNLRIGRSTLYRKIKAYNLMSSLF
ncbi:response regulator of zinc sigma-54-dependent two-component system [Desulfocucumis palustris]|uniref:Response regulator of zinc sigma-54-dependent two-component system n=1 Tax=Desulfocucumis palustris TaxID=1898651 RepID=A0A2L2X8J7_9FIRM|nr:sigma 54-interacting transcriptional regulator [Desulfocucumis palustris]GBF32330.1 response regulator of zinc sigma-54-dependent two-component system [Desulfocucumis palustris]